MYLSMQKHEFYLIEITKIRGVKAADYCLVFIREDKQKVFLLNYPIYKIRGRFNYFRLINFN